MSFVFPMLGDAVLDQFVESCRVATLSGKGDIRSQVLTAKNAPLNAETDFIPVFDETGKFKKFDYRIGGKVLTILGTWYAGSREILEANIDRVNASPFMTAKQKAAETLAGKVVFLAAATDVTKRVTNLTIICDSHSTFLLHSRGLNGQEVMQIRIQTDAGIKPINGAPNLLGTKINIASVEPSVPFTHAVEHSMGLCRVNHG